MKRDQFLFRQVYWEAAKVLPNKDREAILNAICKYALDGKETKNLSKNQRAVFFLIKQMLDRDIHFSGAREGRTTPEYKEWRSAVFKRDNYTCQVCGKRGGKLNAHHISRYSEDLANRTNIDNGITLCEDCHRKLHKEEGRKCRTGS